MDQPIAAGVGGAGSALALAWATEHAERTGARLALVHVCPPGSPLDPAVGDLVPADVKRVDPPLARAFHQARTRLGRHRTILRIRSGTPDQRLADVSGGARLLVIGDGDGGRTVRRVVRHARCPVVVVRPGSTAADCPLRGRVVAAVDGSAADDAVLAFATGYAAQHHLTLVAVHVPTERDGRPPAAWSRRPPAVPVRLAETGGSVADSLIRLAAGAHLLVVGDKRRSVIGRARTGDVPVTVATEAPCPVALIQATPAGRPLSG